jgi:hypothetical protein
MNLQNEKIYHKLQPLYTVCSSVVDPDPAGSEVDPEKIIPDPSSSGSEINFKYNYSEKLKKFDNFSTEMLNLKSFFL